MLDVPDDGDTSLLARLKALYEGDGFAPLPSPTTPLPRFSGYPEPDRMAAPGPRKSANYSCFRWMKSGAQSINELSDCRSRFST
ncbi:hypothetical protein MCEMSEM23_01983 [Rhabdaerophilaceae bacterium]